MATPGGESGRTAGYPVLPEAAWWQVRKQFKTKGMPKIFNEDYLVNTGVRANTDSAKNVVRPFKRLGFVADDGKPTDRAWDWTDDAKYPDVCRQVLREIYPPDVTDVFTDTDDVTRARLVQWFQRTLRTSPAFAKQYSAFYMLLLAADPTQQDVTIPAKPPKAAGAPQRPRTRANGAKAQAAASVASETRASDTASMPDGHEAEHRHTTPRRSARGFEPTLNINVQIHLPAEATTEQIEEIFKSMAKHLYQRQDEAGE